MEQCPDKWRRYHSTTTTTSDQDVLDVSFTVNPRVYCSICARRGHFAENCSQFNKTLSGLITSSPIKIASNKSTYNKSYLPKATMESGQVLQLMTYMDCYKFNFRIPQNCQLYPKFRALFKNHQFEMFKKLQAIQEAPKKRNREKRRKKNDSAVIEEILNDSLALNVSEGQNESIVQDENAQMDDSNSNYSFSDFYIQQSRSTNDENQNQNALVPANSIVPADFIPLQDNNRIPSPIPIENITDAKIMLNKEHAQFLMSPNGQQLVVKLSTQFNITSQFSWDATGNSLIITGLSRNQEEFHAHIRKSLYKFAIEDHMNTLLKSTQAPKIRTQVVHYLQKNLNMIRKVNLKETKKTLELLIGAERDHDHKKTLKMRKTLNIIFMGYLKLREGGYHVGELNKILHEQKREIENGKGEIIIDQQLREAINNHIRYIFSSIDHGNYRELFECFRKIVQEREEKRVMVKQMPRR